MLRFEFQPLDRPIEKKMMAFIGEWAKRHKSYLKHCQRVVQNRRDMVTKGRMKLIEAEVRMLADVMHQLQIFQKQRRDYGTTGHPKTPKLDPKMVALGEAMQRVMAEIEPDPAFWRGGRKDEAE